MLCPKCGIRQDEAILAQLKESCPGQEEVVDRIWRQHEKDRENKNYQQECMEIEKGLREAREKGGERDDARAREVRH
jgi:hypothetical protein